MIGSCLGIIVKIIGAADDKLFLDGPGQGDIGIQDRLVSRIDIRGTDIIDAEQGQRMLGRKGLFEDISKAGPGGCQGILLAPVEQVITEVDLCLWYKGAAGAPVKRT